MICHFRCGREPFLASYEPFDGPLQHFVRCSGCGYIGPVGKTPEEAKSLFEADTGAGRHSIHTPHKSVDA